MWLGFTITGNLAFDFFFSLIASGGVMIWLFSLVVIPFFRR